MPSTSEEPEHPEQYCIVELQGSKGQICTTVVNSSSGMKLKDMKGIEMKMRIGRHDIEGTKQILEKPLIVLTDLEHTKKFKAIGLVREKFIFHERPQII